MHCGYERGDARFSPSTHLRGTRMTLTISAVLSVVLNAQLLAALARVPLPKPGAGAARAAVHQNRTPAGRMAGTTLRLDLDIVESA